MEAFAHAVELIIISTKHNSFFALSWLGILWLVHIINRLTGYRLNALGIIPRSLVGLRGIIFSPFLHGDFNHLFFNSIPFFVLANLVLMQGRVVFYSVSLFIMVVGGCALWLLGKRGIHVGVSTVIMGYFGYLLAGAYFKLNATAIILAIICLYYFGGLFLALLPGKKHVSWEGHVCGFFAGIAASFLLYKIIKLF